MRPLLYLCGRRRSRFNHARDLEKDKAIVDAFNGKGRKNKTDMMKNMSAINPIFDPAEARDSTGSSGSKFSVANPALDAKDISVVVTPAFDIETVAFGDKITTLHPFFAEEDDELTLGSKTEVTFIRKVDASWVFVRDEKDREGLVPIVNFSPKAL